MLLVILAAAADPPATAMALAKTRTAAAVRCVYDPDSTDITVCGRRNADRFRVPFITHDEGDPRHETQPAERARLIRRTTACDDRGPFLIGCGAAGVSASTRTGVTGGTQRPLAP